MKVWVRPRSELLLPHRHVMVWSGGRGQKREAVIQATRPGEVRINFLTSDANSGFWVPARRIISVQVETGQEELDL